MAQLNPDQARCGALFASELQPSDARTAETVANAIDRAVQKYGIGGCAARMAREFGDHPDTVAERMRWARRLMAPAATQSLVSGSRR